MIPKIIWQTHEYKYEDLPENFKETSFSWQILNPGWEYKYHDKDQREQYVLDYSEELHKIYKKSKPPHQADIWRYIALYKNGGVYADMDSFCSTPLDYMLKDVPENVDTVVTKLERKDHTNNANFATVKKSKILLECMNEIINDYPVSKSQTVIHGAFSDAVKNNQEYISRDMKAYHSKDFKKNFSLSMIVEIDYYGEKMSYLDFLRTHHDIIKYE
jgi:hypothetical protein